jgi:hypothetical protein
MSRLNTPGVMAQGRAQNNVYTALAFISFASTLGALAYVVYQFLNLGVFK